MQVKYVLYPNNFILFPSIAQLLWHLSQGSASPLHQYLDTLPGRARSVPTPSIGMLMSEAAVEELQYGPLAEDIMNQK